MFLILKLCFIVLVCAVYTQADVSHLGYRRSSRQRAQNLRVQRLESSPTPYPAAGYRPNREFNLPSEQPLFPLAGAPSNNRPQVSSGFDNLSQPQKPQLVYGSPSQTLRPQQFNGFNNNAVEHEFVETQSFNGGQQPQNGFNSFAEPQQPEFASAHQNGFNNLAETQPRPDLLYGAPNNQAQGTQNGFDNFAEPQYNYNGANANARLRQPFTNRLQQAQRLQQFDSQTRPQRFFNSPQTLYAAALFQPRQQRTEAVAESQTSRLIAAKPARLTDKREEEVSDVKTSETVEDIETTTKSDVKKSVVANAPSPAPAAVTPVVANTAGLVSYYPANAFSFVQPVSGAYVASTSYPTVQPVSAAYTVGPTFLPQQYASAANTPALLQAW